MANAIEQYYKDAQKQVDEQAILDKFNAATVAQYNIQREQNRQNENTFYNQMYNTQQTAMDAIRQANAAAVSTGASRGVQAAQELSTLLGLQQESVASATDLAQANRETAQQETAAMLENVLNAYTQAEQEKQNYVTSAIQSASVDAETENNRLLQESNKLQQEANLTSAKYSVLGTLWTAYIQAQANGDAAGAAAAWAQLQQLSGTSVTPPSGNTGNTGNTNSNTTTPSAPSTNQSNNVNVNAVSQYGVAITEDEIKAMGYDPAQTLDENTIKKIAASKGAQIPVTKSGIQYDNTFKFLPSDITERRTFVINDALKENGYKFNVTGTYFDINDQSTFDNINQVDFNSGYQGGEAGAYINALRNDAKAGKIPQGSIVSMNYGTGGPIMYVYLDKGLFVKIADSIVNRYGKILPMYSEAGKVYVPEGYALGGHDANGHNIGKART